MRWKITTAVLALLLVGTNVWHLSRWVDAGVTLSYREQLLYELANKVKATAALATLKVRGIRQEEALGLVQQLFPGEEPFVKEGAIHTEWLRIGVGPDGAVQRVEVDDTTLDWARPAEQQK